MGYFRKFIISSFLFLSSVFVKAQSLNITPFQIDPNQYKIDSVLNTVLLEKKFYTIILLRDKYTEQMLPFEAKNNGNNNYSPEQSPITFLIVDQSNSSIKFQKKINPDINDYPYQYWHFRKGNEKKLSLPGKLFFSIDKNYGGSGSTNTTYLIDSSETGLNMTKLFSASGELSDFIITKNDSALILISGIWNVNENETHFSNHRYQLIKYTFKRNAIKRTNLGITHFKYPTIDEENSCKEIIHQIQIREKVKFKTLLED